MITPRPRPKDAAEVARLRDELRRQYQLWQQETGIRLIATGLAYAMGLLYLPAWVILPLATVSIAAEIVYYRQYRDLDILAGSRPRRYLLIACVFVIEACFATPPALMWHDENAFAKSLAVGLMASTMMHLATVRSVHLPQGLAGGAAVAVLLLGSNAAYWLPRMALPELLITTVCGLVTIVYCLAAMVANNRLHSESAAGSAAARAANAAKDRLLATISHELRTPLNGILGMGHAELAGAASPEARARLGVLVASAEGLSVILDDILDISAARDGRLTIRPVVGNPADEIAATALLFRHGSEDMGVPMAMTLDPALSEPAVFDRQRFRQCLSNLVSNALRHGQGATVRVRAVRAVAPDGGAMLDLVVADDGPGVPEALRGVLFEPFARLSGPQPEGTQQGQGLGLSIARSLARAMGGDVVLEPPGADGRGAVFRLTLALGPAPDTAMAPTPAIRTLPVAPPSGPLPRVLVVDDIATNRLVAISCLRLVGAEGFEADSGAAALEQLGATAFDVVFLDMNMPGLDGLATLARIRAMEGPVARVKVVAMTADTGDVRRGHYLAAGCDGYLAKPITPERIATTLSSILTAPQAGAA